MLTGKNYWGNGNNIASFNVRIQICLSDALTKKSIL